MHRARRDPGAAGEPGAVGELGREPRLHRRQRGGDHPHRPGAVGDARVRDVRQPLAPLPRRAALARRRHGEQQVVRAVEGDQLGHQRPHQRPAALPVGRPGHPDGGEGAQRHRRRQGLDDGVGAHEAAQGHRGHRLEVLHRAGLRRDQRGREPLGAAADTDVREVRVAGAALPGPRAAGERDERVRIRMGPLQAGPLLAGDPAGTPADLGEIAQVVGALGVGLGPALGATAGEAAGHHAEGGERDHAPEQPRRRVVDPDHDDEADRGQQHHQRQEALEQARRGDARLGGRGLERNLPRRHHRGGRARPAADDLRAHAPPPAGGRPSTPGDPAHRISSVRPLRGASAGHTKERIGRSGTIRAGRPGRAGRPTAAGTDLREGESMSTGTGRGHPPVALGRPSERPGPPSGARAPALRSGTGRRRPGHPDLGAGPHHTRGRGPAGRRPRRRAPPGPGRDDRAGRPAPRPSGVPEPSGVPGPSGLARRGAP